MTDYGCDPRNPRHVGPFLRVSRVILDHFQGKHAARDLMCVVCVKPEPEFPTIVRRDLAAWQEETA